MPEIEITIIGGKVTHDAQGFKDASCAEKTKPLEDALTGKLKRKDKPEMSIPAKKANTVKSKH